MQLGLGHLGVLSSEYRPLAAQPLWHHSELEYGLGSINARAAPAAHFLGPEPKTTDKATSQDGENLRCPLLKKRKDFRDRDAHD